jgi:PAS domain S-box-containing protein
VAADEVKNGSREWYRVLFEDSPLCILILERATSRLFYANPSICRMLGYSTEQILQHSLAAIFPPVAFTYAQTEIASMAQREKAIAEAVPCLRTTGEIFYADIIATQMWMGGEESILCCFMDATERKRTLETLQVRSLAEQEFADKLTVLSEITTELSKTESMDSLCRRAIELATLRLQFERCSIWFISADRSRIMGSFGVSDTGEVVDERGTSLPIEPHWNSLPVIQGQVPFLFLTDVPLYTVGKVVGFGANITVPLWDGQTVIGFLSADNLIRHTQWTDRDCKILQLLASAIAHLYSLKRAEEALHASHLAERNFSDRLTVLSEVTTELSKAASLDALCQQAVILARKKLRFDRISTWFISEDRAKMHGSYGVDARGEITDERGVELPIDFSADVAAVILGLKPIHQITNARLYTQGILEGYGARISAGLWDGEKVIGFISTDNLVSRLPFDEHDCEILRLFASAVGHLCSLKRAEEALNKLTAELEQRVADRTGQLEISNKELDAFNYSISHDLRAPLRAMEGFSRILEEDYGDQLDLKALNFLHRIRMASQRMNELISDLLHLSRLTRSDMRRVSVDVTSMAESVVHELRAAAPDRKVEVIISPGMQVRADPHLLQIALENLLGNAWKFTGKTPNARIEILADQTHPPVVFQVRDNGAGFDMRYADRLFGVFQRLHKADEFEGTGIGLSIVQRIVHRHGGKIWADSESARGASFFFTLEGPPLS